VTVETIARQSWHVFLRHSVLFIYYSFMMLYKCQLRKKLCNTVRIRRTKQIVQAKLACLTCDKVCCVWQRNWSTRQWLCCTYWYFWTC